MESKEEGEGYKKLWKNHLLMDITSYVKNNELRIHIIPSTKDEIHKFENGILYITINAPPEKGKANIRLCKYLKKLTKRGVRIKSGYHSRDKIIVFL